MKQNVLRFVFIFALCCLSGCDFENPFFDPLLYTVTFDAYDWEPGISRATCAPGENVALPSPDPTKGGYVFGGWYTEKDGRGTQFAAKTPVNADIRVYARWIKEENAVTVTFDADGGKPVPAKIVRARGETVVLLPSPNPTKDGYVFEGWYTEKAGGGTQFTEKTPINTDITVYAKWVVYLQVTFDADGGSPAKAVVSCPTGATVTLPSDPTRTDYVFEGWYTEKAGGGTQFTEKTPINTNITVYAKWKPYPRVTFDADGGSPAETSKTCAPGATVKLPSAPTRESYTFEGWYMEKDGRGKKFTSSTQVNADITVYAKWKPYPRITFDADGGSLAETTQTYVPGAALALPSPTRDGYVFEGWYTQKDGGGKKLSAETVITKDITVYARWIKEKDVLTVMFDAEGGTPAPAPITCIKGETLEKLPADPTKSLHTFEGWYTGKNGSGVPFTVSTVVSESITVYAWWKPYPVVTFDADGGTPAISPVSCAPNTTAILPPNPTRDSYVFDGWYTDKKGRGEQFTASSVVTEDITVYAKWVTNLTVNGTLELGVSSIRFPNTGGMNLQKGTALIIALSGSNVDWSGATWELKLDAEPVSIMGNGASRIWVVPPNMKNGQYTATVMIWIGSTLYVGNFPIQITN
ncbi:MAG: InlB B-repeat-containing protein [Treponema sp.]|jgi:uncharacterized repeat protein (TIGR02543 family)|nr:InlB B-repeat-containing protein [Treponema sp.]